MLDPGAVSAAQRKSTRKAAKYSREAADLDRMAATAKEAVVAFAAASAASEKFTALATESSGEVGREAAQMKRLAK